MYYREWPRLRNWNTMSFSDGNLALEAGALCRQANGSGFNSFSTECPNAARDSGPRGDEHEWLTGRICERFNC
jgi:hypothetical protein